VAWQLLRRISATDIDTLTFLAIFSHDFDRQQRGAPSNVEPANFDAAGSGEGYLDTPRFERGSKLILKRISEGQFESIAISTSYSEVGLDSDSAVSIVNSDQQGASIGIGERRDSFRNYLFHFLVWLPFLNIPTEGLLEFKI
jgi:hypothetical protein